jgi:hypothetical protein
LVVLEVPSVESEPSLSDRSGIGAQQRCQLALASLLSFAVIAVSPICVCVTIRLILVGIVLVLIRTVLDIFIIPVVLNEVVELIVVVHVGFGVGWERVESDGPNRSSVVVHTYNMLVISTPRASE